MAREGEILVGTQTVQIPSGTVRLEGDLTVPAGASGTVLFAHGAGSSRLSPRNRYVAQVLQDGGLGTLLFDLLTEEEAEDRAKVFDTDLLAQRLMAATDWLQEQELPEGMRLGYFGASTGAAAALQAAAALGPAIGAVVSRGGRPDLAEPYLSRVVAPTLLIVGELDTMVIELNEAAYAALNTEKDLAIVPGATHLFEEPGALEQVAQLATNWFRRYLGR
ncbi:MAG TPA: dienelactone hydrolase family protein [Anaerolineae bacterium]|nr:dienelactone hydrolase family protein [Anaerolineae bacterium]HPL27860.1 dienelactone hydrolase family protein [Anaerolineae bacterium]